MTCNTQNMYRPVPQSLSDSESEKELDVDAAKPKFSKSNVQYAKEITKQFPVKNHLGYCRKHKSEKMSPLRRFCFIFSLFLCFATVFIFLFVLPCQGNGMCPVRISNWEMKHEGFELKGAINIVKDVFSYSKNLALLFSQSFLSLDSHSGAVALLGNSGIVAWYVHHINSPVEMNCYLIDVNADGTTDCLLIKKKGLEVIDPISGEILWIKQNHDKVDEVTSTSFPIVLPDMNNDNVKEVLISHRNELLLISGATGGLLCEHVFEKCSEIQLHEFYENNILISCVNVDGVIYYKISSIELVTLLRNSTHQLKAIEYNYSPPTDSPYLVNGHKLTINNSYACPNCQANVTLRNIKSEEEILSQIFSNTYVMQPTYFSFKRTTRNVSLLKNHLDGFILKLWQWPDYGHNTEFIGAINATVQINIIKETIVLITFNNTDVQVINASVTEIIQLCVPDESEGFYNCQPNMLNQKKSLLVADIDNDGMQELISYSSTFIPESMQREAKNWQLVSNVRVFRLEAELPKFYRN